MQVKDLGKFLHFNFQELFMAKAKVAKKAAKKTTKRTAKATTKKAGARTRKAA